jgi:hypothetical protein
MSHTLFILRTMNEPVIETTTQCPECPECRAELEHCHEASIEHGDGLTECVDPSCTLAHSLHTWQLSCSVFDPPCPCAPDEHDVEPLLAVAA